MNNTTLGLIYALKQENSSFDDIVINFYSKLCDVDPKYYGKETLMDIATNAIRDYISTADNPSFVLFELFDCMHFDCKHLYKIEKDFDDRVREAIWTTLALTAVKNNGKYVNGFRDLNEEE